MPTPDDPTRSIGPVDALIAEYLQSVEAGQVPNRPDLIARHPDHAEALQTFFADLDRMDRVASPLRMIAGIDETGAADEEAPTTLPTLRYFGDYVLLEEVARGGMGIVYKARQESLNRVVALKMVLSGTFASPREVARFQSEAEAAANLDHPNIVPVYEVGEHEGQQYFSMKFVEGTSLAHHPRASAREEVKGLIGVARAVHHAHHRGVLHRDLKPSNVLIDPTGEPHVTDFGLAKRLGDVDRSLTDPGQVLGTPRYMAPEQAAGRRGLTVAVDVYSLGVILYERLTGRTPFAGDDVLTLLRQVRESEPPRPSWVHPGLDRDLETVVLKCLDKDPDRRYPSAEELSEDLARWLDGRPIQARPVGPLERSARWCRRNPAVAGMTATVALAVVLGAVVSTLFALRERAEAARARGAEKAALEARADTERTFARSLVRPLNTGGDGDNNGALPLSEPEVEALWELAGHANDSLRLRFIEEASRDPLALRQLRARSEPALIAALGLDPDRRAKAASMLAPRLVDPATDARSRTEVAFLLLDLGEGPGPLSEACSATILRALEAGLPPDLQIDWKNHLIRSSDTRDPRVAADLLVAAIARGYGDPPGASATRTLVDVSARLDPAEAARVCGQAARVRADAIERQPDSDGAGYWARDLVELTARLEPAEAARICGPPARALAGSKSMSALAVVAARLEPAEAARLCGPPARALADEMERQTDVYARTRRAETLAELAARLEPAETARLRVQAGRALADAIERGTDEEGRYWMTLALARVVARFEPAEAALVCGPLARALADAIERRHDDSEGGSSGYALAVAAARLEPAEAARICGPLARALADAIGRETDPAARSRLASDLAGVGPRLDPPGEARVANALLAAIGRETDPAARRSMASTLANVGPRLDPPGAARAANALLAAIGRETDPAGLRSLETDLARVLERVEPDQALRMVQGMGMARSQLYMRGHLIWRGLLLGHLDPERSRLAARELVGRLLSGASSPGEALLAVLADAGRNRPRPDRFPWMSSEEFVSVLNRCRLSTQELLELLKMPTCNGEARRVVLDQLGHIHGRRFANHREFVRFAKEKGLKLDFTSPPRRPDPGESGDGGAMERLLDELPEAP